MIVREQVTEDINTYTFDFETEATALQRSLGRRADGFLFVDVDVAASRAARLNHLTGDPEFIRQNLPTIHEWVNFHYKNKPDEPSMVIPVPKASGDYSYIISIRENHFSMGELGEKNKDALKLFTLYHEACHALLPDGPEVDEDHPLRESTADAYAALRFFQRFGQDAEAMVSMISWRRSLGAVMNGDTGHLSTTVLDKIIADSAHRDFSKLTTAQTIKLAAKYAGRWTPDASLLSTMREDFNKTGEDDVLDILAATCASPSASNLAFYVAAKVSQPLLQRKGLDCDGETLRFTGKKRQKYMTSIGTRGDRMSLRGVFSDAKRRSRRTTGPSITTLLKVSLPAGQEQFVLRT